MRRCLSCQTLYNGQKCPKCGSQSWEDGRHSSSTYLVSIRGHFDAAHHLRGYEGPCARCHGHSWLVDILVKGSQVDSLGMVVDFRDLKATLKEKVLDVLDQHDLNEIDVFTKINPTAENLARWIYEQMRAMVPSLSEVRVWESPDAMASYCVDRA